MSEVAALQARLRESPEDWQSWLVYADWLLDQGDIRGSLVQLERRRQDRALAVSQRRLAREEIAHIEGEHHPQWRSRWPSAAQVHLQWRSGFVHAMRLPGPGAIDLLEGMLLDPESWALVELELVRFPAEELPALL